MIKSAGILFVAFICRSNDFSFPLLRGRAAAGGNMFTIITIVYLLGLAHIAQCYHADR